MVSIFLRIKTIKLVKPLQLYSPRIWILSVIARLLNSGVSAKRESTVPGNEWFALVRFESFVVLLLFILFSGRIHDRMEWNGKKGKK